MARLQSTQKPTTLLTLKKTKELTNEYVSTITNFSAGEIILITDEVGTIQGDIRVTKDGVIGQTLPFTQAGSIIYYAGRTAPDGYLFCNGSPVPEDLYPELFDAIEYANKDYWLPSKVNHRRILRFRKIQYSWDATNQEFIPTVKWSQNKPRYFYYDPTLLERCRLPNTDPDYIASPNDICNAIENFYNTYGIQILIEESPEGEEYHLHGDQTKSIFKDRNGSLRRVRDFMGGCGL